MKTNNRLALGLAAVFAAGFPMQASAAAPVSTRTETRASLSKADHNFIERAVKASREKMQISRVAFERTSNPKVREFAQLLLSDHLAASDALTLLASTRGVALPAKDVEATDWAKKDGKTFDRDYIDKMFSSHEESVKLFQKQAIEGEDAEAVAFARKTLPKLQHHLEQATDLKRAMK